VAEPSTHQLTKADTRRLGRIAWPAYATAITIGIAGLLLAAMVALLLGEGGMVRFAHAYTVSFAFALSIALGGLFYVLVTHLFKGGWCVVIRRPLEVIASSIPTMAILSAPIIVFVLANNGTLYEWAQPYAQMDGHGGGHQAEQVEEQTRQANRAEATVKLAANTSGESVAVAAAASEAPGSAKGDDAGGGGDHPAGGADHSGKGEHAASHGLAHYVKLKQPYLSRGFFIARWVLYFAIWSGLAFWYWRQSTAQDNDHSPRRTYLMEKVSAPATLVFALTLTFASFDLLMSLDPLWYSTIFGVYYFAGCALGAIATLILAVLGLKRIGFFPSVNVEHFHDLGKLLFAFTFFWGYIAFSQYMLYWYGNVPAEVEWFQTHGFTTQPADMMQKGWGIVGIILLLGHLLIPFAGLLSYRAKRNLKVLAFWAGWLLVMHWLDIVWLVMPEMTARELSFGAGDVMLLITTLAGVVGIATAGVIRHASHHSLVAMGDPRLSESLAFENH